MTSAVRIGKGWGKIQGVVYSEATTFSQAIGDRVSTIHTYIQRGRPRRFRHSCPTIDLCCPRPRCSLQECKGMYVHMYAKSGSAVHICVPCRSHLMMSVDAASNAFGRMRQDGGLGVSNRGLTRLHLEGEAPTRPGSLRSPWAPTGQRTLRSS